MENIAVRLTNVSKTFKLDKPPGLSKVIQAKSNHQKTLVALDGISFTVSQGEKLGIVGLNASGKTTLLRIIAGVYKPDVGGKVEVNGVLSPLLQLGTGFQADLDARENIIMNGMLLGVSKNNIKQKVTEIIQYAELENFAHMKLKHFSAGMRARLAFATAMQINPDILLVDEILSVGDKDFQKKSYETFLSFTKEKKTLLHATHNLDKLSKYSDRILLLHKGRNIMIGQPDDVIKKYRELNTAN